MDALNTISQIPSLIFIVGPTASGKSALAMRLAQELNGEIICADSQTIRRGLDLGTAKPTAQDRKAVPHHLVNIIGPYDLFSAAEFKKRAELAIADITNRGKVPIIVGGTGLYVDALYYNYSFSAPVKNDALRKQLANASVEQLQKMIIDKKLPMPSNSKNPRHLVRTLESGGIKATDKTPRKGALIIGLTYPRDVLAERIIARIEDIFKRGFLREVQNILDTYGTPPLSSQAFDAIAYKLAMGYLEQGADAAEMPNLKHSIARAELHYTKRQMTWFKRNEHIHWFDNANDAYKFVCTK